MDGKKIEFQRYKNVYKIKRFKVQAQFDPMMVLFGDDRLQALSGLVGK